MKLTIVGCSGSLSGEHSAASCYLLQAEGADVHGHGRTYSIVMDLGSGAMGPLLTYVDPARLDALMFSHMHADHCADLVGMQVYRRWYPEGALGPVAVFSPVDGAARVRGISGDDPAEDYATEFEFQVVTAGDTVTVGPMVVEFFAARHSVPAYSLRVSGPSEDDPGKTVTVTYSGDTDYAPTVVEAARDADLFLCEAAFEEGRDTVSGIHLTGARAGKIAAEAQVSQLLLTHMPPWTSRSTNVKDALRHYSGTVTAVKAGDIYTC